MSLRRVALAAFALLAAACSHEQPPIEHAQTAVVPPRVAEVRAPDFEVFAPGGVRYSSRQLVGKQPFVAVFFATWCGYCEGELKTMQRAFQQIGPMPVIPVSVDGPETWDQVPAYLASFGIHAPAVRAYHYRRFAAAYNPADILPSVVIVGGNGALVDYLHGYDPAHERRLLASLRQAKAAPPLPQNERSAQNEPRASDDPDDPDDPVGPANPAEPGDPAEPGEGEPDELTLTFSQPLVPASWCRLATFAMP
jgi:thiol-disulfide isomerase/thioredoxin